MNKLPVKQIFLLTVIIAGIVGLSVYSTYAIFTLESETADVVSIHTPNSLNLQTDTYEYKQITIPKSSYITTDIDIYNNFSYDLCYSIWYRVIGTTSIDPNKVEVYQDTADGLSTNGIIESVKNKRISIFIVNDNESDAKINIGLAYAESKGTCELNISEDKSIITETINNPLRLTDVLIDKNNNIYNEAGYLTYKDKKESISLSESIFLATSFDYQNEMFTLKNPEMVDINNLDYYDFSSNNYYTCLTDAECGRLYRIIEINNENIIKYDLLEGYQGGLSGLRQISNNYYYYGDNPKNFVAYNCKNDHECELWRIIGIVYDSQTNEYITKIIRNDSIGTYQYNSDNNYWINSTVANYLNEEYYKKINNGYLTKTIIRQENITDLNIPLNQIKLLDDINTSYITIPSLSDYLYTSTCQDRNIKDYDTACISNSWLKRNNNIYNLTMSIKYTTPVQDEETEEENPVLNNTIYTVSNTIEERTITDEYEIRPVAYLKPRIYVSAGDGSLDNPYIIK